MQKKTYHKRRRLLIASIILLMFGFCVIFVIADQWHLTVAHYDVTTDKLSQSVRIVELADLHNKEFGQGNRELVQKVGGLKPDLIAMTGDMNSDEDSDEQVVLPLIE